MTTEMRVIERFTQALTSSPDAQGFCRDLVHGHAFDASSVGIELLAVDFAGELKSVASYGRGSASPASMSLWDENPVAVAINGKSWVVFEAEGGWNQVVPFSTSIAPLGGLVILSKKQPTPMPKELQHIVARLGGFYLQTNELASRIDSQRSPAEPEALTQRQREILGLMSNGQTNADIAGVLLLSESTIRQETVKIYRLLGVGTRSEAWKKALALGLIRKQPVQSAGVGQVGDTEPSSRP